MHCKEIIRSLEKTTSTMDSARQYMTDEDYCLVSADSQSRGRGTQNRPWLSPPGNVHMTIGIRENRIVPGRKPLLQLESGLITIKTLENYIWQGAKRQLEIKWPNDILLNGKKVAGLLLEKRGDCYFIGIGINTAQAPIITKGQRPSGRLADFGMQPQKKRALIHEIYTTFKNEMQKSRSPDFILKQWKKYIRWNKPLTLREQPDSLVKPVDVSPDGLLAVQLPDGSVRWLRSDYLA